MVEASRVPAVRGVRTAERPRRGGGMNANAGPAPTVLDAYLLGVVPFEAALRLQRQLVYGVSGDRARAAVVLCEHPTLLTVGRQGGLGGLRCDPEELRRRGCPIR